MFGFIKELGKIEIECIDPNGENIIIESDIKSVQSDYIIIDFLSHEGIEYEVIEDEPIKVFFRDDKGIHSGICYKYNKSDPLSYIGIKLTYPKDITFVEKFVQKRDYLRVALNLNIELVVFLDEEWENAKFYNITSNDISGSGISFISDDPIKDHFKVAGVISLSSTGDLIEVSLEHVYSKAFFSQGKQKYKNAFKFVDIDEESREKILTEIFLYDLEMRKKGV